MATFLLAKKNSTCIYTLENKRKTQHQVEIAIKEIEAVNQNKNYIE